jgi:hypothetical protein
MALMNSLQMGFRTLALEKRSSEVWQVLGAVKTEFGKFGDVLAKVKSQTETVLNTLNSAEQRSRVMGQSIAAGGGFARQRSRPPFAGSARSGRGERLQLLRLILSQVFLHTCMAGVRMAAPLWALRQGYSEASVGVLLALFALTQVFFSIAAGPLHRPCGRAQAGEPGRGLRQCRRRTGGSGLPIVARCCASSALLTGGATGLASIALQRHVGRIASQPRSSCARCSAGWPSVRPCPTSSGHSPAGLLIDHAGFRWAFLAMALLPVLSWLFVRRTRELPPVHGTRGRRAPRASGTCCTSRHVAGC